MKCPKCKKNISGANKHKVKGIWYHKKCPVKKEIQRAPIYTKEKLKRVENALGAHQHTYRKIRLRRKVHNKVVE